ncbi:MAG TPA: hypothetical protein VF843_01415 [Streptosporangiaceae bacterium]
MNAAQRGAAGPVLTSLVLIALFAAGLTACGRPAATRLPVSGVLRVTAVTGLPAVTRPITTADVQKDSTARGLAVRLRRWGYAGGWQRTFQGESRRLTLVVSRSLTFRDRAGAGAFVGYLTAHLGAFYPYAQRRPLTLAGQSGWMIKPPECACHMAEPLYVGVVRAGRQVRWLEINGPRATGALLDALLREL